jgi:hypothetical protein
MKRGVILVLLLTACDADMGKNHIISHEHLEVDGMNCVMLDQRSLSCDWSSYSEHAGD